MMVWSMELHVSILVCSLFFLILSIMIPLHNYIFSIYYIKNMEPPLSNINLPNLTIFLPVKNEELLIKSKLEEIFEMDYPKSKLSILIIDSGSSDSTSIIAEKYLSNISHNLWQIENISPPGKSIAVNYALEMINTKFFVMMDAESILKNDALKNIVRWFQDSTIGAVCGQLSESSELNNYSYRNIFNRLRTSESALDSTPIFEGSICGFRKSALQSLKINPNINADDTQLSLLVRKNGYRAIMDPDLKFFEPSNKDNKSNNYRELRRAQGLSRVFWENKDLLFFNDMKFRSIFRQQFYFYLVFPWFVSTSILLIYISSIIELLYSHGNWSNIFIVPCIIFLSLINKSIREIFSGIIVLLKSHIMALSKRNLHIWESDINLRKSIYNYRNENSKK